MTFLTAEPLGQSWLQLSELGLAFVLSAMIGLERGFRQKSAGLRTCTLVGLASALIILISKFGFTDILVAGRIVLDPSRIAAQIVTGIGFIGGGVIFVRKDVVRGLTTAATVWLASAVGMACGAGLPVLALAVTAGHFVVVGVFPYIERKLPQAPSTATALSVSYREGREVLQRVIAVCTQQGFAVIGLKVEGAERNLSGFQKGYDADAERPPELANLTLTLRGRKPLDKLAIRLLDIDGVVAAGADEDRPAPE